MTLISYKTYHINRGWSGEFQPLPANDTPVLLGYLNSNNEIVNDLQLQVEEYNLNENKLYHEFNIQLEWIGYQKTADTNCQLIVAVAYKPEDLWNNAKIYSLNNYIGNVNYNTASINVFIENHDTSSPLFFAIRSAKDQIYCNVKSIKINFINTEVKKAKYYNKMGQCIKDEFFTDEIFPIAPALEQKLGYQDSWNLTNSENNTYIYNIQTAKIPYKVLISNNIDQTKIEAGTCFIDSYLTCNIPDKQGYIIDTNTEHYKNNELQLYVTSNLLTKQNNTYVLDLRVLYLSEKASNPKKDITITFDGASINFSPSEKYYLPANLGNKRVEYWIDESKKYYSPYLPYDYNTMISLQGQKLSSQVFANLAPWPLFQKISNNNYAPIEIFVKEEVNFNGT